LWANLTPFSLQVSVQSVNGDAEAEAIAVSEAEEVRGPA
jgi:hypothetical protein